MKAANKMFAILETLCKQGDASCSELAAIIDQPKSSVFRFLSVLVDNQYVVQDAGTKKYRATLKIFRLGSLVRDRIDVVDVSRPLMEDIGKSFKETINLGLFDNRAVVYIHKVESTESVRTDYTVGRRVAAYCTALGKVFLADLTASELEEYFNCESLERRTSKTITSKADLKKELIRVRDSGYSFDNEEFDQHNRCVAAPIRDQTGRVVAALSISGPAYRMGRKRIEKLKDRVVDAAEIISRRLGYQR